MINVDSVPENFLEECRHYQAAIEEMRDPVARDELGKQFCGLLFGRANHFGESRIIVRADVAFVSSATGSVNQTTVRERTDTVPALQFREVVAQGRLGNPEYSRFRREGVLAWTLYDARVGHIGEVDIEDLAAEVDEDPTFMRDRLPVDRPLHLPIHLPVAFIDTVLCASGQEPYQHSERVTANTFLA
jgi:hypothetical protein